MMHTTGPTCSFPHFHPQVGCPTRLSVHAARVLLLQWHSSLGRSSGCPSPPHSTADQSTAAEGESLAHLLIRVASCQRRRGRADWAHAQSGAVPAKETTAVCIKRWVGQPAGEWGKGHTPPVIPHAELHTVGPINSCQSPIQIPQKHIAA